MPIRHEALNVGLYKSILVRLLARAQVRSWNQLVLSNGEYIRH